MSTHAQRPESYFLGDLLGLQNFDYLRHPDNKTFSFSDIDAWAHSFNGNRHLFADLKTTNEGLSSMGGQLDGLMQLSRLPGCQVLIIFDPWHGYPIRGEVDVNTPMRVEWLRNGSFEKMPATTLGKLRQATFDWQKNEGSLREDIIDYRGEITKLVHQNAGNLDFPDKQQLVQDVLDKLQLADIHKKDYGAKERKRQAKERDDIAKTRHFPKRPAGWVEPPTFSASQIIEQHMNAGATPKAIAMALADARAAGRLQLS